MNAKENLREGDLGSDMHASGSKSATIYNLMDGKRNV